MVKSHNALHGVGVRMMPAQGFRALVMNVLSHAGYSVYVTMRETGTDRDMDTKEKYRQLQAHTEKEKETDGWTERWMGTLRNIQKHTEREIERKRQTDRQRNG